MKYLTRILSLGTIPGFCGARTASVQEYDDITGTAGNIIYAPQMYLKGEFSNKRKQEALQALAFAAVVRSLPKGIVIFSSVEDYRKFLYSAKRLLVPTTYNEHSKVLKEVAKAGKLYLPVEPLNKFTTEYKRIIVGDWVFLIPRKHLLPWGWHGREETLSKVNMTPPQCLTNRHLHSYPLPGSSKSMPANTEPTTALDRALGNVYKSHDFVYSLGTGITRYTGFGGKVGMMKFMMGLAMSVPNNLQRDRDTWQWNGDLWVCNALGHFTNPLHANRIFKKGDKLPSPSFGGSTGILISAAKEPPPVTVKYISL